MCLSSTLRLTAWAADPCAGAAFACSLVPRPASARRLPCWKRESGCATTQLRFCASNLFFQITVFSFKRSNPLIFFAEFFLKRLTLYIRVKRQFQLLVDLEIALQNPGIVFFNFFFGNFKSRRNDVKVVAGPHLPCLTLSSC